MNAPAAAALSRSRWREPAARAFLLVWAGQTVSAFGSAMTTFALSVWVFGETRSLLAFGSVVFVNAIAAALAAPWLGMLCDRVARHRLMLAADAASALLTMMLLAIVLGSTLALWQIVLLVAANAVLTTAHQIAYRALVPSLIAPRDLVRANALIETGFAASALLAPLAGGLLVAVTGLAGILAIDLATFAVAVACLAAARIRESAAASRDEPAVSRLQEIRAGWTRLRGDRALRGLLVAALAAGFAMAALQVLLTPLVLLRHDAATLGLLLSASGLGMAAGGALLLFHRRRPSTALVVVAQAGMGVSLLALGMAPHVLATGALLFALYACSQFGAAAVRSVWQSEIEPALRGRAFAAVGALSALLLPPACLGAPWLAEHVLQPWLQQAPTAIAALVGRGPGAGAAVLIAVLGLGLLVSAAALWRSAGRRELDRRLAARAKD